MPPILAQQDITNACAPSKSIHDFDVTRYTHRLEDGEYVRVEYEVSSEGYRVRQYIDSSNTLVGEEVAIFDTPLTSRAADRDSTAKVPSQLVRGKTTSYRRTLGSGRADTWSDWSVSTRPRDYMIGDRSEFCGHPINDQTTVQHLGSETVNGTSVEKYSVNIESNNPSQDWANSYWTYWIDSSGRILKLKMSESPDYEYSVEMLYSDYGQANTITAPIAAPTEEPTEEPTLITPPTPNVSPPPAPSNLNARANNSGITLTWDAPDDDSVTHYQILRRRPQLGENSFIVYVKNTGNTATTYIDSDTGNGVRHIYRVRAISPHGKGPRSNAASATSIGRPGSR